MISVFKSVFSLTVLHNLLIVVSTCITERHALTFTSVTWVCHTSSATATKNTAIGVSN